MWCSVTRIHLHKSISRLFSRENHNCSNTLNKKKCNPQPATPVIPSQVSVSLPARSSRRFPPLMSLHEYHMYEKHHYD